MNETTWHHNQEDQSFRNWNELALEKVQQKAFGFTGMNQ
jgi:hypothetical protein